MLTHRYATAIQTGIIRSSLYQRQQQNRNRFNWLVSTLSRQLTTCQGCLCSIGKGNITKCVVTEDFTTLRRLSERCSIVSRLRKVWQSYEVPGHSTRIDCQLFHELSNTVTPAIIRRKIPFEKPSTIEQTMLSVFVAKQENVTLAGEGGAIVGNPEYWEFAKNQLSSRKINVVSIGGAIGYDAIAINRVFRETTIATESPQVVDPNLFAAFFSLEHKLTNHYAMTAQSFFSRYFERRQGVYLYHIGTTLNVVQEKIAMEILINISRTMQIGDIISIIMVDEAMFQGNEFAIGEVDKHSGLSKVYYKSIHYKTVIKDRELFNKFMLKLKLNGTFTESKSPLGHHPVLFIAFKSLK